GRAHRRSDERVRCVRGPRRRTLRHVPRGCARRSARSAARGASASSLASFGRPGSTLRSVSTKPAAPVESRPAPVEDIRSARPYLLSRTTLVAVVRRLASVAALVAVDLLGLVLGVFVALILREAYLGQWPPLWGILWDTETNWLPFLTVVTVLVFWVGGLYRRRELRAGLGQVVFSLVLVAVITLAFGLGTGYHFT